MGRAGQGEGRTSREVRMRKLGWGGQGRVGRAGLGGKDWQEFVIRLQLGSAANSILEVLRDAEHIHG